ncbi:MAG: twin-arginine translocase TatA/TatE family subunit [Terriglobales bacterium]
MPWRVGGHDKPWPAGPKPYDNRDNDDPEAKPQRAHWLANLHEEIISSIVRAKQSKLRDYRILLAATPPGSGWSTLNCGGAGISCGFAGGGFMEGLFQPMHLLIIFFIALLVFGPKKLPELGKGLGDGIRALKEGMRDNSNDAKAEVKAEAKAEVKPENKA